MKHTKKTMVIIEGPDNIGKTQLAIKLATQNLEYYHFGANKSEKEGKKYNMDWAESVFKNPRDLILDRSFLGEFVYGPLFRKYKPDYLRELMRTLEKSYNIFIIILYAENDFYKRLNIKLKEDTEEDYASAHHAHNISRKFVELLSREELGNCYKMIFNLTNYKSLDILQKTVTLFVEKFLKKQHNSHLPFRGYHYTAFDMHHKVFWYGDRQPNPFCCPEFSCCPLASENPSHKEPIPSTGNISNPKFVFVGEAPGNLGAAITGIPFYHDISGTLFRNALFHSKLSEAEVMITNPIKCAPYQNCLKGYTYKKLPCVLSFGKELIQYTKHNVPVVALGRTAEGILKKNRIEHRFIYHPSYFIRMGKRKEFIHEFKEVITSETG